MASCARMQPVHRARGRRDASPARPARARRSSDRLRRVVRPAWPARSASARCRPWPRAEVVNRRLRFPPGRLPTTPAGDRSLPPAHARVHLHGCRSSRRSATPKLPSVAIESAGRSRAFACRPVAPATPGRRTFDGGNLPAHPAVARQRELGRDRLAADRECGQPCRGAASNDRGVFISSPPGRHRSPAARRRRPSSRA